MTSSNTSSKGFTLIELLVVISIISLLSSVALASLNSAKAKARDAKRMEDSVQIRNALALYELDHGGVPVGTTAAGCYTAPDTISLVCDTQQSLNAVLTPLVSGGYISQIPKDPVNSGGTVYRYITDTNNRGTIIDSKTGTAVGLTSTADFIYVAETKTSSGNIGIGGVYIGSPDLTTYPATNGFPTQISSVTGLMSTTYYLPYESGGGAYLTNTYYQVFNTYAQCIAAGAVSCQ